MTSLETSVKKLLRNHYEQYPPNSEPVKECMHYVRHANHILKTLVAKRTSLEFAVEAFEEVSLTYVKEFGMCKKGEGERQRSILTAWFTHFLRLRDGFQLMESGERRHKHDDDMDGAGGRFKSRLSGALRKDGVTRKFKSTLGYTGYGWDEFYDEDVGVKQQLLDVLFEITNDQRTGSRAIGRWEENLDNHETERKLLSERLTSSYKSFVDRMNQLLAAKGEGKLKLITDDKAEKLTWGFLDIKRSGNKFAIADEGGSIPIGMTLRQWKEKFALQLPERGPKEAPNKVLNKKPTKKRLRIEESSDEEDGGIIQKPQADQPPSSKESQRHNSSGIEVQIRKSAETKQANPTSSVNEIKRGLGFSANQLEEGRNQLDHENRASAMAACNDEMREIVGDVGEKNILSSCINAWNELQHHKSEYPSLYQEMENVSDELKAKLSQWKSNAEEMTRARSKTKDSDSDKLADMLYKARENYREACMQLGNQIMDDIHPLLANQLNNLKQNKNDSSSTFPDVLVESETLFLQVAQGVYKQALALIKEQLSCYPNSNLSNEKQWEKTQHLLLRARAQYNIGISIMKLAQCNDDHDTEYERRQMLLNACRSLQDASQSCDKLRHNTVLASNEISCHDNSKTWAELAVLQIFQSLELFIFCQDVLCACLWEIGRFDDAESVMTKVDTARIIELESRPGIDLHGIVRLLCDSQRVSVSLLDLSAKSLENTPSKQQKVGEKFLQISRRAAKSAIDVSNAISAFAERHSLSQSEKFMFMKQEVLTADDLKTEEGFITEIWERKTGSISVDGDTSDFQKNKRSHVVDRGELHYDLQRASFPPATTRVTISDSNPSHRRRRIGKDSSVEMRAAATESFHSAFVGSVDAEVYTSRDKCEPAPQKYMPWGDEMLEEGARNKYPACCPPLPSDMPLEIRRALEARLGDILPSN